MVQLAMHHSYITLKLLNPAVMAYPAISAAELFISPMIKVNNDDSE
jgi:hypothetical protein